MPALTQTLSILLNPAVWGVVLSVGLAIGVVEWIRVNRTHFKIPVDLKLVSGAITQSRHLKHGGGISDYFFNIDQYVASVDDVKKLSGWYLNAVNEFSSEIPVDVLAFIEKDSGPVGVLSLMGELVIETNLPAIIIRLKKRNLATKIIGSSVSGKNVLIISDVITTGRTVKDAISAITGQNGNIAGICALLNRQEEPVEDLQKTRIIYGATEQELIRKGYIKLSQN